MAVSRFITAEIPQTHSATRALALACASLLAVLLAMAPPLARAALTELEDSELTSVSGEGLTFTWTDFRTMFDPQSYFEQQGSPNGNTCTATGSTAGNYNCWRRADLRWFGANVSNASTAVGQAITAGAWNTTWDNSQCTSAGVAGLGCPRGGPIALFAAHDNPYILRAMPYAGDGSAATAIGNGVVTYQGNNAATDWNSGAGTGSRQTTLELLAPTSQDPYRLSFWGELEVGRGATGSGLLQSQTILIGNASRSVLRFFRFTQTTTSPGLQAPYDPTLGAAGCTDAGCANVDAAGSAYNNRTLAIQYESRLRADFRFSVAQTGAAPAAPSIGTPQIFDPNEGAYFRNADVYIPLGQPFYQALTINLPRSTSTNAPVQDGNFTLEIPLLPNRTAVFTRFYSLNTTGSATSVPSLWDYGYATARSAFLRNAALTNDAINYMPDADITTAPFPTDYPAPNANYYKTHGFARWGDWYPCQGRNCILPTTPNTVAQADGTPVVVGGINITGRNSWRSDGDGVFFKNIAAYNAYSYRMWAVDARAPGAANDNEFTHLSYMSNHAACTPASATDAVGCGYGGAYLGAASFGSPVVSQNIVAPENLWLGDTGLGGAVARNVVAVPSNSTINLGDSRIEGLQINYLRFTSYGANF